MAEFNLQVGVDGNDTSEEEVHGMLAEYVEATDEVEFADGSEADWTLEIDTIDRFATIYTALRDSDENLELGLWGGTAERFPVPVQHYALQQISTPDAYEFHALDNKVTLVIADSQQRVQQLQQEVPPPAIG